MVGAKYLLTKCGELENNIEAKWAGEKWRYDGKQGAEETNLVKKKLNVSGVVV